MNITILFCHRFVINSSLLRTVQQWQVYFKERAGSDAALHAYLATVSLDNPLHNGQAQCHFFDIMALLYQINCPSSAQIRALRYFLSQISRS